MKSYTKYTIKTHKIDDKNIDKLEFKNIKRHSDKKKLATVH